MRKALNVRINLQPLIDKKSIELYGRTGQLKQQDIAEATGIPQGTLSRWQNGKVDSYKGEILAALMNYFECEIQDLLIVDREAVRE